MESFITTTAFKVKSKIDLLTLENHYAEKKSGILLVSNVYGECFETETFPIFFFEETPRQWVMNLRIVVENKNGKEAIRVLN